MPEHPTLVKEFKKSRSVAVAGCTLECHCYCDKLNSNIIWLLLLLLCEIELNNVVCRSLYWWERLSLGLTYDTVRSLLPYSVVLVSWCCPVDDDSQIWPWDDTALSSIRRPSSGVMCVATPAVVCLSTWTDIVSSQTLDHSSWSVSQCCSHRSDSLGSVIFVSHYFPMKNTFTKIAMYSSLLTLNKFMWRMENDDLGCLVVSLLGIWSAWAAGFTGLTQFQDWGQIPGLDFCK